MVGKDTGGDFEDVVDDFANGIEQADLEEVEVGIEEDEDEEGLEKFEVLEEAVSRELFDLGVFFDDLAGGGYGTVHMHMVALNE